MSLWGEIGNGRCPDASGIGGGASVAKAGNYAKFEQRPFRIFF